MQSAPCTKLAKPPPSSSSSSSSPECECDSDEWWCTNGGGGGSGGGGWAGRGAMRVRLSVPRPILWCIENKEFLSSDAGGVRLNAQMMSCTPSGGA